MDPAVLTIAGTDPLCGAGCAADLATFRAFGWPGLAVETAFVVQNSRGVVDFEAGSSTNFRHRLMAVFEDCEVAAIKIGMLGTLELAAVVGEVLCTLTSCPPIVLDPVSMAGQGRGSLRRGPVMDAFEALRPKITLITPNAAELSMLTGLPVHRHVEAQRAADVLHVQGFSAVLLKGGHLNPPGEDRLSVDGEPTRLVHVHDPWPIAVHGTGCHLSSAIACGLAASQDLHTACREASRWLDGLVRHGAYHRLGKGRAQFDARRLGAGFD